MAKEKKSYLIIGLMSGTSMDGLDIALCKFDKTPKSWKYSILKAQTIPYNNEFRQIFTDLMKENAMELAMADAEFGTYCGEQVLRFIKKFKVKPDLIASHGHTVFHQPERGFTFQLGNGAYIHAASGFPVVSDFRSVDVGLGGQGAPLVPIGDKLLFGEYEYCLNMGGIANISFDANKKRIAYDICPVNVVLNKLANDIGKEYDKDGENAAEGKINKELLKELNELSFYRQKAPKSLGREWIDQYVFPMVNAHNMTTQDKLATFCEHIAIQISSNILPNKKAGKMPKLLLTGGGSLNKFLIERIKAHSKEKVQVVIPEKNIISFKEALVFAFLGLLRVRNENNSLASVTGASRDNIGGAIYGKL